MREPPNCNNGMGHRKRKNNPYQHKYAALDCQYCIYFKNCNFNLCPAIVDNFDDLILDDEFFRAAASAKKYIPVHKKTLIAVHKYIAGEVLYA